MNTTTAATAAEPHNDHLMLPQGNRPLFDESDEPVSWEDPVSSEDTTAS